MLNANVIASTVRSKDRNWPKKWNSGKKNSNVKMQEKIIEFH